MGGDGNDLLLGNGGRNLLIGGTGTDTVIGGNGDDLLIAGFTDFDNHDAALAAIMAEWTSSHSYAERVANLSGVGSANRLNGEVFLTTEGPAATVHSDLSADVVAGGGGTNWYFADLDGIFRDTLLGRRPGEVVGDIDTL